MKVYIAHYNNGESWGDYSHNYGDKVYVNKSDCEREILKKRFRKKEDYYIFGDRYSCEYARIEELELME